MRQRVGPPRRLSRSVRLEIWQRVAAGERLEAAARAVGCAEQTVYRLLNETGGVALRLTPRATLRLAAAEREEISRGW